MYSILGEVIKEFREANGDDLFAAARRLGITPARLSKICNGKEKLTDELFLRILRCYAKTGNDISKLRIAREAVEERHLKNDTDGETLHKKDERD